MEIIYFADGEILTRAVNSVRGKNIYLVQSTSYPVNDNLMELLIAIDALKRGNANSVNVIIPYFGYARQDRKVKGRQPITCKLIANLITTAGANSIITIDLHSPQSMGFFDVPVDNLKSTHELVRIIIKKIYEDKIIEPITIVSPDHGGLVRVRNIADVLGKLSCNIAVIDKKRINPNTSKVQLILGNVKNKICFIVDDIIDTAGTICNAAKALKKYGAKEIYILACHGVFSNQAKKRLSEIVEKKYVKKIIVTNTIDIPIKNYFKGLEIISIANLIANIIKAIIAKKSLSQVYQNSKNQISLLIKKINIK